MGYHKGKLLVREAGSYYVYAKTCFRYYNFKGPISDDNPPVDVKNTQLFQYLCHESIKHNSKAVVLSKMGSTMRWNGTTYNMYCAQQGRGVQLDVGDALFVNVSNAFMLDLAGEATYFGAIKWGIWNLNTWGADMLLNIWYAKEPLLVMLICQKSFFFVFVFFKLFCFLCHIVLHQIAFLDSYYEEKLMQKVNTFQKTNLSFHFVFPFPKSRTSTLYFTQNSTWVLLDFFVVCVGEFKYIQFRLQHLDLRIDMCLCTN